MNNLSRLTKSEKISALFAITAVLIALLVLVGWIFEVPLLKSVMPGYISMKSNTALALLSLALGNLALVWHSRTENRRAKIAAALFIIFGCAIGVATIFEYVFGLNLGIDELMFIDVEGIGQRYPPGRLAPITAVSFIFIAASCYLSFFKKIAYDRTSQILLFAVGLISFQAIISYMLGIQTTFGVALHTRIALHTAVALILICCGLAGLRSNRGFMRTIFSETQSGRLAQQLIVAALLMPPLVAFFGGVGLRAGWYDGDFETLFRVLGSVVFFVIMVVINSERLHKEEGRSQAASDAVLLKEKESARLIAERQSALEHAAREASMAEDLKEARARAEKATEAKAMFLANMSHEIRTPLNGVIGIADLLADTKLDEQQAKYIDTLQKSGLSLLSIINDILDFSKIEAGKMELEQIDFNLGTVIHTQCELADPRLRAKSIALEIKIDEKIPSHIHGDGARIGQVLLNLLTNATKFTEKGFIRVRAERKDAEKSKAEMIRISVTDSGIGMSLEVQQKLFQAFVQADGSTSRRYGGTGLGLSICQSLATLMGGDIGVVSEEGYGSTFWFEFPLVKALAERKMSIASATAEEMHVEPFANFGRTIRILVAEDNSTNQLVVAAHLKSLGVESQTVANGFEVMAALIIGKFDLILMDCQMPELDGFGATRLIRENERAIGGHIPIVALTANAMKEDRDRCLAAGMDDHLVKPYKRKELRRVLEAWIKA